MTKQSSKYAASILFLVRMVSDVRLGVDEVWFFIWRHTVYDARLGVALKPHFLMTM